MPSGTVRFNIIALPPNVEASINGVALSSDPAVTATVDVDAHRGDVVPLALVLKRTSGDDGSVAVTAATGAAGFATEVVPALVTSLPLDTEVPVTINVTVPATAPVGADVAEVLVAVNPV